MSEYAIEVCWSTTKKQFDFTAFVASSEVVDQFARCIVISRNRQYSDDKENETNDERANVVAVEVKSALRVAVAWTDGAVGICVAV